MICLNKLLFSRHFNRNNKYCVYFHTTFNKATQYSKINKETGILTSSYTVTIPKKSLVEHVWEHSDTYAQLPAATCAQSDKGYTYKEIRNEIKQFAKVLLGHFLMKPKEVVGILLPNNPEYIIVSHGAMEAGLTVTFVNPLYTQDEIARQFLNASVKMIITLSALKEIAVRVGQQLPNYKATVCIGGTESSSENVHNFQNLMKLNETIELPKVYHTELAILPYSSGTSGIPKGVMLSHFNLVANVVQTEHPAFIKLFDTDRQETSLTVLPLCHIYGFNAILNISLRRGVHVVTLPKFIPEHYIKALLKYRPHNLFVVPTLLNFFVSHPAITKEHLSSVKVIYSGAAPASEELIGKFKDRFGSEDIVIKQGYGMTESSPVTLSVPVEAAESQKVKWTTVGCLYPNTEAKVLDVNTNRAKGPNEPGELLIKGPQVMLGYFNNKEATLETIDEEGWLHTGDVAYYDENGFFYIVDRCKELIKVKGNQVSPTELENIILQIPGVADVAVVGIPDPISGEIPKAFIIKHSKINLEENDIRNFVNSRVVHYKKLAEVKFVEAIPRNPSGKILRNVLRKIN